jgi:N-acetyl-gamma-glutamyl-phosphate reductase
MQKIKIGIIGATGYTGLELARILSGHPGVSIEIITSESYTGKKFSEIHPSLRGIVDDTLQSIKDLNKTPVDVVFLALPHGVSMNFVKEHGYDKYKVIDLSGDFRLPDAKVYKQWYGKDHVIPEAIQDAVFGLPELFGEEIKNAHLIANPGCYPTSCILPMAPLVKNNLIDANSLVFDSKSGVTGAGAKAKETTHFPNTNDNFKAYGLFSHRHTPEIQNVISTFSNAAANVLFTPHLLPLDRGILTTAYAVPTTAKSREEYKDCLATFYKNKPFVQVVDTPPAIKEVRGSNFCKLFVDFDERTNRVVTVSVIDNLVKGAAGQAVQNMNLACGLDESTGLMTPPLAP